jgi:hypothetical protein
MTGKGNPIFQAHDKRCAYFGRFSLMGVWQRLVNFLGISSLEKPARGCYRHNPSKRAAAVRMYLTVSMLFLWSG